MITRTEVRRAKRNENGEEVHEGFIYAGIMTYKKVKGKWLKDTNVATLEPLDSGK